MKNNNQRNFGIDVVRIFACLMVILYHVPQFISARYEFQDVGSRALNSLMFYIGRCAVPLFFIISGYLLLPMKMDTKSFFKRRFIRIVIPTLLWFVVINVFGKNFDNLNNSFWIGKTPHFWYMYALFSVYLIMPIVSIWYKDASLREKFIYLGLWIITLLYVVLNEHFEIPFSYSHQGMLFTTPLHSLFYMSGYLGYFLLGAIIRDREKDIKAKLKLIVPAALLLYITLIIIFKFQLNISESNTIAYCSLTTCILSTIIFILFIIFVGKKPAITKLEGANTGFLTSIITDVSNATFSIYFMHVLFLEYLEIETIGGYSRLLIGMIVFFTSFIIYKVLSYIPYSKFLLG